MTMRCVWGSVVLVLYSYLFAKVHLSVSTSTYDPIAKYLSRRSQELEMGRGPPAAFSSRILMRVVLKILDPVESHVGTSMKFPAIPSSLA